MNGADLRLERIASGWRLSTRKRCKSVEQRQWVCVGECRTLDAPLNVLVGLSKGGDIR